MMYLVNGRVKQLKERMIDIYKYDSSGCCIMEYLCFKDGSIMFAEECIELSFKGLREYFLMQVTKLMMRFHYWNKELGLWLKKEL
jgi:hypothetical protein